MFLSTNHKEPNPGLSSSVLRAPLRKDKVDEETLQNVELHIDINVKASVSCERSHVPHNRFILVSACECLTFNRGRSSLMQLGCFMQARLWIFLAMFCNSFSDYKFCAEKKGALLTISRHTRKQSHSIFHLDEIAERRQKQNFWIHSCM